MDGAPEEPVISGAVPVAVAALLSVAVGGDDFPPWFDLGAWVAEKDAWELEWGRLVDWVGDQEEACIQLIGLEARLRAMYEWLLKTEDVSAKHREVREAASQWEDDTGEVLQWYGLIQDGVARFCQSALSQAGVGWCL